MRILTGTIEEVSDEGIKEDEDKLDYEIDWKFVESMARRMAKNKGKYPPNNWKKPIEVDKLKNAMARHFMEIMNGNYTEDTENDHLVAIALNAMMINYQLQVKQTDVPQPSRTGWETGQK